MVVMVGSAVFVVLRSARGDSLVGLVKLVVHLLLDAVLVVVMVPRFTVAGQGRRFFAVRLDPFIVSRLAARWRNKKKGKKKK